MIPIDRQIRRLLSLVALVAIIFASPAAFGQDDEEIDDGMGAPLAVMPVPAARAAHVNPDQVDQWVFGRWGGSALARARFDANLALRIDDIDRACSVTEVQKKKLKLAGLGDIKRYYDRVEDLKRQFVRSASDPNNNNNNIWQEMQPLQIELNSGLFGEDSIFVKTIKKTLSSDQAQRYDGLMRRRGLERRRATIEWFVVHLDKALGLTERERSRLVELLASETPPPNRFGQADFWYLMYQMTRLPEAKIKAILDEPQWRLLSRQFVQARGMEPWLRSNGLMGDEKKSPFGAAMPGTVQLRVRQIARPAAPAADVPAVATPKK